MVAEWDAPVDDYHLNDPRFTALLKRTPTGPAWAVTRVKAAATEVFKALDDATDEDELWGVVASTDSRVALEALRLAVPEWGDEFEERFNERMLGMGVTTKFEVRPAERAIRNVILGLCGAAGGGKTCSALRVATGLAAGGDIVLIDTEGGKATEFAPRPGETVKPQFDPELPLFRFNVIDLDPPHSPERFRLAVLAAARARPRVLIIDNITDELHGQGGELDMKDAAPDSDKFGWIEPKRQHRALMNALRARPWYVVLTIRAKEKIRPATREEKRMGAGGVINEGWLPQCDGSIYYDTTLLQLIDGGVPNGVVERPWKLPPALRGAVEIGRLLTEETGRRIARWAQPTGTWEDQG